MINITNDNISPGKILGAHWGAKALPHVTRNAVVATSDVESVMKMKVLIFNAQMPSQ